MTAREHPEPRGAVSVEFVDYLRGIGASDDLVAFTDRHAARFSRADMDRAGYRAFLIGVDVAAAAVAIVAWIVPMTTEHPEHQEERG